MTKKKKVKIDGTIDKNTGGGCNSSIKLNDGYLTFTQEIESERSQLGNSKYWCSC